MNEMKKMVVWLREHNSTVRFDVFNVGTLTSIIVCDVPVDELVLPEGFYANPVYGITNAGNSPEEIRLPAAYSTALFA